MKTIIVQGNGFAGIMHEAESAVVCHFCERPMPIEDFSESWDKGNGFIRKKCKGCKRYIGITTDAHGDFIFYQLQKK